MANNAVNIPVGLDISDLVSSFKFAGAAANDFTTRFGASFAGVTRSVAQPAGAFNELTRNLQRAQREIRDTLATGGSVSAELTSRYAILSNRISTVNNAFNPAQTLTGFAALNQRLTDTKQKMQELLATGQPVPQALTAEFRRLEAEVNQVNQAFTRLPTSAERLKTIGTSLQSTGRSLSTYLTAPLLLAGGAAFKSYAEIDSLIQGFKVTSGSVAGANREFREYYKLSQNPGLGFEEVEKAGLKFEALGFKSKVAQRDIKEIGNAIALGGGSKVDFNSVITQFTQMSSKAKVLGDDLKPILNSSPVIAKAINQMFGTTNSDDISKKLQAAGKGPQQFLAELVDSLAKLDRAQAGPLNAIENFGDALKIAGYEVGLTADKTLNLTDKINGLGVYIGDLAHGFGTLDPSLQTTILGVVGLAGSLGPLSLGLGTVIQLLPTFRKGLLALVSPVSLTIAAVAAVAALGYSLYKYNQTATTTIDKGAILAETNAKVTAAIGQEKASLESLVAIAKNDALSKETRNNAVQQIIALSPDLQKSISLETIKEKEATEAIDKYVTALQTKARFQALVSQRTEEQLNQDNLLQKSGEDFVDLGDKVAAGLQNSFKDIPTALGNIARNMLPDAISIPLNIRAAQKLAPGFQADLKDKGSEVFKAEKGKAQKRLDYIDGLIKKEQALAKKQGVNLDDKPPGSGNATNYLTGFSESELEKAKDRLAVLRKEIFAGNKNDPAIKDKIAEARQLETQIANLNKSIKPLKIEAPEVSKLTVAEGILNRLTTEAAAFGSLGLVVPESLNRQIAVFENDVLRLKGTVERRTEIVIPYRIRRDNDGKGGKDTDLLQEIRNEETYAQQVKIRLTPSVETDKYKFAIGQAILPEKLGEFVSDLRVKANFEVIDKQRAFDELKAEVSTGIAELSDSIDFTNFFGKSKKQEMAENATNLRDSLKPFLDTIEEAKNTFAQAREDLKSGATNVFEGIFESVGKGQNPLKQALAGILNILGDFLIKQGAAMLLVAEATSLAAAVPLFGFAFAPTATGSYLAAAGLIAGGGLVKGLAGSIGSYAKGGVFHDESIIRVSEYANSSRNPEIVTPQNIMADTFQNVLARNLTQVNTPQSQSMPSSTVFVHQFEPVELRGPDGSKQLLQLQRSVRSYEDQNGKPFKLGRLG